MEEKLRQMFEGKRILVTGGTGTLGRAIVKKLLKYSPEVIRILDMDETNLFEMQEEHQNNEKLRFLVGNIREKERLVMAMENVDYVFHLAALKHVTSCEYNPMEAINTNILGIKNVIEAALINNVKKVIYTSSDKAVNPSNTMGATKLLGERLISAANYFRGTKKTIFASVRFGNVIGSRGSVLPIWKKQMEQGKAITVTNEAMTRFMMSQDSATELMLKSMLISQGAEIFIMKMPVVKIGDLADAFIDIHGQKISETPKKKVVGPRIGESLYEELMTEKEAGQAFETDEFFVIPTYADPIIDRKRDYSYAKMITKKRYSSENEKYISKAEIKKMLEEQMANLSANKTCQTDLNPTALTPNNQIDNEIIKEGLPKIPGKILLINPPIRTWAKPNCFPLGLGYIASILQRAGHHVEVIDINGSRFSREEVEEKIKNAEFDIAGTGGLITTYNYVKWLCEIIKKYHPGKKIITGGSVATSITKILLENIKADIAVIGEGELTIVELVNAILKKMPLEKVKGIWFKDNEGRLVQTEKREPLKNLDDVPLPAWELFPTDIYLKNPIGAINKKKWEDGSGGPSTIPSFNVSGTRGCPYRCIYCYHDFLGYGWRNRSARNIVNEFKELKKRYNVGYIHFVDDEFCLKKEFVKDFCEELIKENVVIMWGCTGRVNLADRELYLLMKKAGCISICYGIESGSQKMLDVMKKMVTVDQAKNALKLTQEIFGENDVTFMVGMLGETKETIGETIQFCKDVGIAPESIFFVTPYPGTELYEIAKEKGLIKNEVEYIEKLGEQGEQISANLTSFSDEELKQIKENMVKELKAWNKMVHEKNG